jgi:hypothetical protein
MGFRPQKDPAPSGNEGTAQGGTQNIDASGGPNRRFDFDFLPLELRLRVYADIARYDIDAPGITIEVRLEIYILPAPNTGVFFTLKSPPGSPYQAPTIVTALNREARQAFRRRFPQRLSLFPSPNNRATGHNIYFDKVRDTIFMDIRSLYNLRTLINRADARYGFDDIQNLATPPMDSPRGHRIWGIASYLRKPQNRLEGVQDPIRIITNVPNAIETYQGLGLYLVGRGMNPGGLLMFFSYPDPGD